MKNKYVLTRGYRSGVHFGKVVKITKEYIYLEKSRRVWRWSGAASLSELAVKGGSPESKICCPCQIAVQRSDVSEIIECSQAAIDWFHTVEIWNP